MHHCHHVHLSIIHSWFIIHPLSSSSLQSIPRMVIIVLLFIGCVVLHLLLFVCSLVLCDILCRRLVVVIVILRRIWFNHHDRDCDCDCTQLWPSLLSGWYWSHTTALITAALQQCIHLRSYSTMTSAMQLQVTVSLTNGTYYDQPSTAMTSPWQSHQRHHIWMTSTTTTDTTPTAMSRTSHEPSSSSSSDTNGYDARIINDILGLTEKLSVSSSPSPKSNKAHERKKPSVASRPSSMPYDAVALNRPYTHQVEWMWDRTVMVLPSFIHSFIHSCVYVFHQFVGSHKLDVFIMIWYIGIRCA